MLGEVGELASPCGQLICTAAVVDDVLSLLLLAEVQVLGEDDPEVRNMPGKIWRMQVRSNNALH